nr:immunoglobulin heavy chain junction region [Macaca mulatta]
CARHVAGVGRQYYLDYW